MSQRRSLSQTVHRVIKPLVTLGKREHCRKVGGEFAPEKVTWSCNLVADKVTSRSSRTVGAVSIGESLVTWKVGWHRRVDRL